MNSKEELQIQSIYSFPPSQEASAWCLLDTKEAVFFKTLLVLVLNDLLFGELTLLRLCFILGICNQ